MCVKEQFVLNLLIVVVKEKERTLTLGYVTRSHLQRKSDLTERRSHLIYGPYESCV